MKKTPCNQKNRIRTILAQYHIRTDEDIDALEPDSPCIDELYAEYVNSGVMPMGVARARTGDPMQWIIDRIRPIAEIERLLEIAFERIK